MKKLGSLFLAFVMLVCALPLSAAATTADDNAEALIFELDLSEYEATNTVKNAVPDGNSTITVGGLAKPAFGVLPNGTKYINFKESYASEATQSYIEVEDADFVNQYSLTVETWVRPKGYTTENEGDYLFKLYSNDSTNVSYWDMYRWGTSWLRHRPSGNAEGDEGIRVGQVVTPNQNLWTHMVFTRTWVPDEECPKDGIWESAFYINGKRVDTDKPVAQERAMEAETSAFLIGNGSKYIDDYTFVGDMATFKVYQNALDADTIETKYNESRGDFAEYGEEKLVFDMDLSEFTDENPVVKSAKNDSSVITVQGTPKLGISANGQKYLTFDDLRGTVNNADSDAKAGIKVVDNVFMNQKAMTVEALVRGNNFGTKPDLRDRNYIFHGPSMMAQVYDGTNFSQLWWNPVGDKGDSFRLKQGDMQQFNDKWTHFVFTKAYDSTAGKWVGKLYIDGAKTKEQEYTAAFGGETSNVLMIGSNKDAERSFDGDIATFKVYNTEFTEEQVAAKYEDSLYVGYDEDRLIFDMDLSEYTTENPVVKSATVGSREITIQGTPTPGAFANGRKYLTFDSLKGTANNAASDAKVGIRVADDLFMNQKAMTVEALVRGNNFGPKSEWRYRNYLFQGPSMQAHVYDTTANSILCWDPAGDKGDAFRIKQGEMQNFNDKWTHFVFTKAYDSEAGKWVGKLYIDGVEKTPVEYEATFGKDTSNVIMIGLSYDLERSFDGDIATFKVYNTELTADKVKEKYEDSFYIGYSEDRLVFDMDLSEYTAENPVVKSTTPNNSSITLQGTPTLGTTANGQKYLTFDNLKGTENNADSDAKVGIKVVDDLFMNQKAMTVETWVRGNNFGKKSGDRYRNYLFQGPNMQAHVYDTTANSIFCWDPAGDKGDAFRIKQGDMQNFNDKWTHFVFTKVYDSEAGKWVGKLYIDGERIKTAEYAAAFANSTSNVLMVGISNDLVRSFDGDIATFKVYNTELTETQVEAKYEESQGAMQEAVSVDDFSTTSTEVKATLSSSIAAQNPYVVMALYNKAGSIVQIGTGTTLTIDSDITLETGYFVRCFVWNSSTELKPLAKDDMAYCR